MKHPRLVNPSTSLRMSIADMVSLSNHKWILLAVLLLCGQLASCQSSPVSVQIKTHAGLSVKVRAEVAHTPQAREHGLMFREKLPEGEGMLFVFPEKTRTPFWMKDTPLSLDLIFIRDHRIVDVIEKAAPYSLKLLEPHTDYKEVLEVPGGFTARHGIQVGDSVAF